ncbi:MAG: hypothetical protein K2K25_03945, partial [Muribaculaceae bacterium]|nr:hypothetical protein [Muribaculaceae bacterium]
MTKYNIHPHSCNAERSERASAHSASFKSKASVILGEPFAPLREILRSRHLTAFALLTLTLALATLPVAAEVVYSGLKELKHLERIPVTSDGNNNSAKLSVPINGNTAYKLLDGDKSTSWQSWTQRQHNNTETLIVPRENYSANSLNDIWHAQDADGPEAIEFEINPDGTPNYFLTTKAIHGLGSFMIFNGVDNYVDYSQSAGTISFLLRIKGSKTGVISLYGGDTYQGNSEETTKVPLNLTGEVQEQEIIIPTAGLVRGVQGWLAIDASQYDGDITVYSLRNFKTGGVLLTNYNAYIDKTEYKLDEDATTTYSIAGNTNNTLSISDGPLRVSLIDESKNGLGYLNVLDGIDFRNVNDEISFKIRIKGAVPGNLNFYGVGETEQEQNGEIKTEVKYLGYQSVALDGNIQDFDVILRKNGTFTTNRGEICIDAANYHGDLIISSITDFKIDGVRHPEFDKEYYTEEDATKYTLNGQNYTMSRGGGRLVATYTDNTPVVEKKGFFHFALAQLDNKDVDKNAKYKVRLRLRGDTPGSVYIHMNNVNLTPVQVETIWREREVTIDHGTYSWGPGKDWIGLFAGFTRYNGKLDIDWVEVYRIDEAVEDGYVSSTEKEEPAFANQHFKDWTTTTGVDGKVHIPEIYKYGGYDPAYNNGYTDEANDEDHRGYITFTDGGSNNYNYWKSFTMLSDLSIDKNKKYRIELELKGSKSGAFRLALGMTNPYHFIESDIINVTTDWSTQEVYIDPSEIFNHDDVDFDKTDKAILNCNVGMLASNIQFRSIRILELPEEIKSVEDKVNLSGGWPFNQIGSVNVENEVAIIKKKNSEGEEYNQQVSIYHGTFKKGRKYVLKAEMKCEGQDLDLTHYQQFCRLKKGWTDEMIGYLDKILKAGDDFVEVSLPIGPYPNDVTDFINFFNYGWNHNNILDNVLYIRNIRLVSSNEDEKNEYCDYSTIKDGDVLYNQLTELNGDKATFEYIDGKTVLYAESKKNGTKGLINLTLKPQTNYRVKVHLRTTNASGDFNIRLGDDNYLQKQTVNVGQTGWQTIEADFYDFNCDGNGYCVIEPGSSMSGDVIVDWVEIMELQPALTDNSEVGYNYFDLRLPEPIKKGDIYYVNVRRGATGAPTGSNPIRFRATTMVDGGSSSNEVQQGEYAIGGYSEVSHTLHKENAYDKDMASNQFVRVEIVNEPVSTSNTLRLYCTGNVSGHTVIMQTQSNSSVSNVRVPSLSFAEVGLYKFAPWKNTAAASNATWVMPMIYRFQLEANAIRGNYPSNAIDDAIIGDGAWIGGLEKSRFTSVGNKLFDGQYGRDNSWQLDDESHAKYSYKDESNKDVEVSKTCLDILLPPLNANEEKKSIYKTLQDYENGMLLKDNKINLVVQFGRSSDLNINFPLEIRYCGTSEDNPDFTKDYDTKKSGSTALQWKTLVLPRVDAYDDILFSIDVDPSWRRVRIECAASFNQNTSENTTNMNFGLAEIRAFLEFPKIDLDQFNYDVLYNDRLLDYHKIDRGEGIAGLKLSEYVWKHTRGTVESINNPVPYATRKDIGGSDDRKVNRNEALYRESGEYRWADGWESDGFINKLNEFSIGNSALKLADFNYITKDNPDDSDGLNEIQSKTLKGDRQRTYVVTHEIYTLPGKRVDLYPYSDMHSSAYYEDQFVRWYDYKTDGTPENLFFFTDPKSVIKTKDYGFYGSRILLDAINRGPGTVGSVYFSKDDVKVKNNNGKVPETWIAADFAICLADSNYLVKIKPNLPNDHKPARTDTLSNFQQRFGVSFNEDGSKKYAKEILEPTITYRHLFHIKDASQFVDDFSGSYDKNIAYLRKNRKYISARAGVDFTIRLENAMPLGEELADILKDDPEDKNDNIIEKYNCNDKTKSAYFYKKGDGDYGRVCSYAIVAYDASTFIALSPSIKSDSLMGNNRMFIPYKNSFYNNVNTIVSTKLEDQNGGADWIYNNRGFARAIYCKGANATEGKYLVRVYGKDEKGDIIKIFGSDNKPLVVAEYEVTFLPLSQASFLPEHRLKNLKPSDDLYSHTETYLEATFNKDVTHPRRAVNFDKYSIYNLTKSTEKGGLGLTDSELSRVIYQQAPVYTGYNIGNYTGSPTDKIEEVKYDDIKDLQQGNYLKVPLDWTVSNYGFGVDWVGDYNLFRLADHSSATVYNSAASRREASTNPLDSTINATSKQRGVYDRLFYNTNGGQKGMFYYVNAASDPGDIVEINVDNPCAGSTLYVSGWVNEFNDHRQETANIIVNYYANVAEYKNTDGTAPKGSKIIRRIQMKGFETGYVPNHSSDMSKVYPDGKQGDWMHFYFSFVPNKQRVLQTLEKNSDGTYKEGVVNYSIVLENNSVSSWGADYAIDDIRAYVAPPRVEAYQTKPVCDSRNKTEDIPIEIRLPFESLLSSLGISEDDEESSDNKNFKTLQYALLDKKKYDDAYEEAKSNYSDPENNIADIQREAFAKSVISYPHVHIDNVYDSDEDRKNKSIPWGII